MYFLDMGRNKSRVTRFTIVFLSLLIFGIAGLAISQESSFAQEDPGPSICPPVCDTTGQFLMGVISFGRLG